MTDDKIQIQQKLSPWIKKLKKAIANRRAFELIRDKDFKLYKKEQSKKEQKEINNITNFKSRLSL